MVINITVIYITIIGKDYIMICASDFILNIHRITKLHESMLKTVCEEYGLTLIEAKVISFLHNNPGKDTAADISELRLLKKSNVSLAVEILFQKSMLDRKQDKTDRRKIHLSLTPKAAPVVRSIDSLWEKFQKEIFMGISENELKSFKSVNDKIEKNIIRIIGKDDK